jgi:tryptophanyl-tRNA synthetase
MANKTIDPWGSVLVEDYEKIIKDFGLEVVEPSFFPNPNRLLRRSVLFAGRDLKIISKAIKEKKRFYVLTGLMPSGEKIHFGNKMVVESLKYFQEQGADTFILVADLEAAATRGVTLEEAQKRAMNFHIPAYIALGLDPKKTTFYFQSQNLDVVHLAYEFAQKITLNEFKAVYGSADPSRIMSAMTQVGDILYPQLEERMPGIIPVGIDQDPHIRLTRDIVKRTKEKYKFFAPSTIINKYTPSLDGDLKMSKSKPMGNIDLPEDANSVKKKIMRAKTGGRDTIEEQKKKGGEPEKCMVFELYKQHLIEDDKELQKIYEDCKAGKLMCGDDKKHCAELMKKFMNDFTSKLEKARKNAGKLKFIKFK